MKKYCIKSIKVFNYLVILLPLAMAVFLSVVYLLGGWGNMIEGHDPDYYFLKKITFPATGIMIILLWIAFIVSLVWIIYTLQNKIKNIKYKHLFCGVFIFAIAFGIRFLFLYIYSEDLVPFSDFSAAWERARGNLESGNISYYSLFPAYLNFSLYENKVIELLGEKYIYVLYLNAVYSGLTASLLYFISKECVSNEVTCIASGIIYAMYPSNIVYIAMGTPDFLAIFLNTLGMFILLKADKINNYPLKILLCFLSGVALGTGGAFKTFSLIIFIAFSMVILMKHIINIKNIKNNSAVIICALLMVTVMFVGYKSASVFIMEKTSDHYNIELDTKAATPHYLLIGLNTEAEGQIHIGTISRSYCQEYLSNGMNYEEAKKHAFELLKNDWKYHKESIVPNFAKKMIWAWQDDYIPIHYYLNHVGIRNDSFLEETIYSLLYHFGGFVSEIIYLGILVFAIIGAVFFARNKKINFNYEFLALIVFGYFCMILLAEGQSRYKCLVMAYLCIIASNGMEVFRSYLKKHRQIRKR